MAFLAVKHARTEKKKHLFLLMTDAPLAMNHLIYEHFLLPPSDSLTFCDRKIFSKQAQVNNLSNNTMLPSKRIKQT